MPCIAIFHTMKHFNLNFFTLLHFLHFSLLQMFRNLIQFPNLFDTNKHQRTIYLMVGAIKQMHNLLCADVLTQMHGADVQIC